MQPDQTKPSPKTINDPYEGGSKVLSSKVLTIILQLVTGSDCLPVVCVPGCESQAVYGPPPPTVSSTGANSLNKTCAKSHEVYTEN